MIAQSIEMTGRPWFSFGRSASCEVVIEHPSSSRVHAVVQFRQTDSRPFVFDCGSTDGTFLNKKQLKAQEYTPLAVGDQLKFGQSTRMYILAGPAELMPEEGPSLKERKELAYKRHVAAKEVKPLQPFGSHQCRLGKPVSPWSLLRLRRSGRRRSCDASVPGPTFTTRGLAEAKQTVLR